MLYLNEVKLDLEPITIRIENALIKEILDLIEEITELL